jgi:hypothetical protein
MQKLRIRLTEADILNAQRFKISNLILYALQNATGTLWRLNGSGLALETMSPFRVALLPNQITNDLNKIENVVFFPYECELETFILPVENSELLQHLYTLNDKKVAKKLDSGSYLYRNNDDPSILALLAAMQRDGWNNLHVICPQIIVETTPPHRTFVVKREMLQTLKKWFTPTSGLDDPEDNLHLKPQRHILLELHSPLESELVQHIKINLDDNLQISS